MVAIPPMIIQRALLESSAAVSAASASSILRSPGPTRTLPYPRPAAPYALHRLLADRISRTGPDAHLASGIESRQRLGNGLRRVGTSESARRIGVSFGGPMTSQESFHVVAIHPPEPTTHGCPGQP